jgi:5S rRNA maturation endonuclease (ribonuclease M5)
VRKEELHIRGEGYMLPNRQKGTPSITDIERAERLREILEHLHEVNKRIPVIVEGKKDASALRKLGLVGDIMTLHNGKNLYEFCTDVSEKFHRVILLLDWDRKGEDLTRILSNHLKSHWEEFSSFREMFKMLCQKEIKDIEGIPKLLRRLEGDEIPWQ